MTFPMPAYSPHLKWTPKNLPDLVLWYDPSDLSTMWQNNNQSGPVTASGQPVGYLADKSGSFYDITGPTLERRPVVTVGAAGSPSFLTFASGSNQRLSSATSSAILPMKTMILGARIATSDASMGLVTSFAGGGMNFLLTRNGSNLSWLGTGGFGSNIWHNRVKSLTYATGTDYVLVGDTSSYAGTSELLGLMVGQDRGLTNRYFSGRLYGLIMTDSYLSAADIAHAENWMAEKMGITL